MTVRPAGPGARQCRRGSGCGCRVRKLAGSPAVVVVLATVDAAQYVLRALRAGAAGFLVKPTPPEDLIGLVQVAAEGHTVLSPAAARRLIVASFDRQPARDRPAPGRVAHRPRGQVLACLGEGLSNAQIAARLYLSEARVKGYVSRRLDKLGCANCAQAGLLADDAPVSSARSPGSEAAGWNSGWVPGRPGCVLRPDVRARRVQRASRARREPAAVAIMSLTRSVASCCRISGCMGSSWVRRAAAGCRAGRSSCRGTIRRPDRPGGR